ncbi:MAG: filamentous hemagglutinin N-terminal domain-containing protein [Planctomycetia bacterium]|nr:filamentous hemagglutinin N-terminal domain-containing protein [Planctomycetia bacterium]
MRKFLIGCVALVFVMGTWDANARKLPVETKGGPEVRLLDVSKADKIGTNYSQKYWYSFDVGKGQTFQFVNNDGWGIVNIVTSKKRTILRGTIESYKDNQTILGGTVFLVNPNGFTIRKGFTFRGDEWNVTVFPFDPSYQGFLNGVGITLRESFDKTFTLSKGTLFLNKKGAVSGNASFDLPEGGGLGMITPSGQNLRIGSVTLLNANSSLTLTSGKNLTVRNITGSAWSKDGKMKYNEVGLMAQEKLRVYSAKDVNMSVMGKDMRLTKPNASSLPALTFLTFEGPVEKFSIAKGTWITQLNYYEKSYGPILTPKRVTEKNYWKYLEEIPED